MWRDVELPSEILAKVAREKNLEGPLWHQQPFSLTLGGITYALSEFGRVMILAFLSSLMLSLSCVG